MLLAIKTLKCHWCVSIRLVVRVEQSFFVSQIVGYQVILSCQFCLSPSTSHGKQGKSKVLYEEEDEEASIAETYLYTEIIFLSGK